MPQLPTLDDFGPRAAPTPQSGIVPIRTGQADAAVAGIAETITQIGTRLTDARRSSQLSDALGKATFALGEKEIEFQRDQDFKTSSTRFEKIAKEIGESHAGGIDDPGARELFQRQYEKLAVNKRLAVVMGAARQEGDYNKAALTTNLDTFAAAAAGASNEAERRVIIDQAKMAIGEMRGGDGRPGWISDVQAKALEDRFFVNYFDAWRLRDPVAALEELQKSGDRIRPDMKMRLEQHLFQAAAPLLAKGLMTRGGSGVVMPPAATEDGKAPEALPRGVRNNNPGNIVRTGAAWGGEIAGNDPRYAAFDSPEAGIRALGKNLIAYQEKHGLDTVAAIVARWAPATENDTASYVKAVSGELGVKADQPLDMKDPVVLARLTKAIIKQENGSQPYSEATVRAGVEAALGNRKVAAAAPISRSTFLDVSIPTNDPVIDRLPADQKLHVLQLARAEAQRAQHEAREALKGRVADTEAAYFSTGAAPNPPSDSEILFAYGQDQGPAIIRRLRDIQQTGQNIQQVKTLPDREIEKLVEAAKPQPGEGYAQKLNDWKLLANAADTVRSSRRSDPVAYAAAAGLYGVKPMQSLGDPAAVAAELGARAKTVVDVARDYGTMPTLLTKPEASALAGLLRSAPVETQKTYLATLFNGVGQDTDLFKVAMRQVAPDAPVLAVAGIYQGRRLRAAETSTRSETDVADMILRGNAILHPNKKTDGTDHAGGASLIKMPEEKLMLADWNSKTGDAFKGKEQANDVFQQVARSIYASLSAESGDYSGVYDATRWRGAIALATGGIDKYNGSQIVMPYGWKLEEFKTALSARVQGLKGVGVKESSDLLDLPLESVGDGRYIFRRGAGYIVDKDGMPLTVNFNVDAAPPSVLPNAAAVAIPNPGGFAVTAGGAVTGIPKGRK